MNYQLRTGNLITCSLSSGNHLSRTMTAPPAPYFKFPIRRLIRHQPEYIPGWVHHCGTTKNFRCPTKGVQLSSCWHVRSLRCYLHSSFRRLRGGKTLLSKSNLQSLCRGTTTVWKSLSSG